MNTRSSNISGGCFLYVVVVSITALCIGGHQAGNMYVIAAKPISTTTATSLTSVIIKRRPSSILKTKTKTTHDVTHDATTPTRVASVVANTVTSSEAAATEEDKEEDSSIGIYVDKPILRGQFHKYGAILYPFLFGLPLYFRAISKSASAAASASAIITSTISPSTTNNSNNLLVLSTVLFNLAIESIMIISATLHTYKWKSNYWHLFTRKLDFTAIFVGIALIYSSLGKLLLGKHPLYFVLELVVWISAIAGTIMKWFIPDCPHYFNGLIFMVQGWAGLPLVPTLFRTCHICEAMSILSGGIFITLGAIAYSCQWPKPKLHLHQTQRDIKFGPHELFHVSSLLMFLSMWYTMWFNVSST
jgi:channel protein (hemolysin III family)